MCVAVEFSGVSQTIVGDGEGMCVGRTVGSKVDGFWTTVSGSLGKERHPQVVQKRMRKIAMAVVRAGCPEGGGNFVSAMCFMIGFWTVEHLWVLVECMCGALPEGWVNAVGVGI